MNARSASRALGRIAMGCVFALSCQTRAAPPSTAFSYQGSLAESGSPANGPTEMTFKLWDAVTGGSQIGGTLVKTVSVVEGVFSESLDFGSGAYAINQAMWLEIIVEGQSLGRTPLNAVPFSLNTRGFNVLSNGFVGLNNANPDSPFVVDFGSVPANGRAMRLRSTTLDKTFLDFSNTQGNWSLGTNTAGNGTNGNQFVLFDNLGGGNTLSVQRGTGFVGIGTNTPQVKLDVEGNAWVRGNMTVESTRYVNSGGASRFLGVGTDSGYFLYNYTTQRNAIFINSSNNHFGIGTDTPATTLDVNGAVTIRGGADLVEGFESSCGTAFEPGTVLSIDPRNPGQLMCSEQPYDRKVAGVVSGANGIRPGIKLGQDGAMDGDIAVAMTGRVYVKASAENGAIMPGDRLTTAALRGHAMKATDGDLSDGAVIGKAMTGLEEGTGLVLVLVNLQ